MYEQKKKGPLLRNYSAQRSSTTGGGGGGSSANTKNSSIEQQLKGPKIETQSPTVATGVTSEAIGVDSKVDPREDLDGAQETGYQESKQATFQQNSRVEILDPTIEQKTNPLGLALELPLETLDPDFQQKINPAISQEDPLVESPGQSTPEKLKQNIPFDSSLSLQQGFQESSVNSSQTAPTQELLS